MVEGTKRISTSIPPFSISNFRLVFLLVSPRSDEGLDRKTGPSMAFNKLEGMCNSGLMTNTPVMADDEDDNLGGGI